jgi:type VI protein secretion system component Hcp
MTIYMKADGLHGGVTAKGHEKWIQIESYRFSASRNINTRTGRVSDREGSIPSFSEIILNKFVDQSSADLHTKMFQGASLPTVQIDICYTGTELTPHIQYTLSNVIISHIGETAARESRWKRYISTIQKLRKNLLPVIAAINLKPQNRLDMI